MVEQTNFTEQVTELFHQGRDVPSRAPRLYKQAQELVAKARKEYGVSPDVLRAIIVLEDFDIFQRAAQEAESYNV